MDPSALREAVYRIMQARDLDSLGEFIDDDDDLNPGDHIAVERTYRGAEIQHHGIIVPGRMAWKVIHFAPEDLTKSNVHRTSKGIVRRDDLSVFAADKNYVRVTYDRDQGLSAREVMKLAEKYQSNQEFGEYNGYSNNCEHFATFCKTGKRKSNQTKMIELVKLAAQSILSEEKWKDRDNNVMDLAMSAPAVAGSIIKWAAKPLLVIFGLLLSIVVLMWYNKSAPESPSQ